MKNRIKSIFLGFMIGATMSVPGVSGGTTAIALGCYEKILTSTAKIREKGNMEFLFFILCGGILGFFSIAGFINQAFRILPVTMTMIFCAAAGTGIYLLGKETLKQGISVNGTLFFLLGFGSVFAIEKLPESNGETSPLFMILWGILLAVGIILPGISTSHLLLTFGLYDNVTQFSGWKDFIEIIPLGIGVGLGILLLTKPLAAALKRYPAYCRFVLLGFAVGSVKALILPCIENPQITYLPWFQAINGGILSFGAILGILKLSQGEKKLKKL